jgi:(p)ppGpp synthase/HD superfamily hydrolase
MNVNQHLNYCFTTRNKDELERVITALEKDKKEYDKFFEEYLELFDDQMNANMDQSTPVWKAYKEKYDAYTKVNENLKMANYYLGMI